MWSISNSFLDRTDPTFSLYLGGVPETNYPNTEQYVDITFRRFLLVKGLLTDAEIKKITKGSIKNVPLDIQNKYEVTLDVDFNNNYSTAGSFSLGFSGGFKIGDTYIKDLSDNNYSVKTHNFGDISNSLVDL